MQDDRLQVLVLGQTPPPVHGQAVMIEQLLEAGLERVDLHHVRMSFSRGIDDVGRFRAAKVGHLMVVVAQALLARRRYRCRLLYYPPAGPNRIPMYRDVLLLSLLRPFFRKTIFHFHASGITDLLPSLLAPERALFWHAYAEPDGAILLSDLNPPDGERLRARETFVIPYGIEDEAQRGYVKSVGEVPSVLFVGALMPSKGVMTALEAAALLRERDVQCRFRFMGAFASSGFERQARHFVEANGIVDRVEWLGTLTGTDKWQAFADCEALCFPTYYEVESFGIVLIEAMQFGKPVVATRWRGIPSVVLDGQTGYLVPPKDPAAVAHRVEELLKNPDRAEAMGRAGRERYSREYSLATWTSRMENAFLAVANGGEARHPSRRG